MTAGNASGLNDGAAALLLASEKAIARYHFRPLARVVSWAVSGVEPRLMGIGPVEAARQALAKAGLRFADLSLIELNEAFAAQVLAWGIRSACRGRDCYKPPLSNYSVRLRIVTRFVPCVLA